MRSRSPSSGQLGSIPSCAGLFTRFACARAREVGIDLRPLVRRAHLSMREINDERAPLAVPYQIDCLNLIAGAMNDKLLGFHLLHKVDVRKMGFLYYAGASSETLGEALRQLARYSVIANEGIALETHLGKTLRVRFDYAGVSRLTDRHQIEAWITGIVRACREVADRDLQLVSVKIMHQRIPESSELDSFFGCTVEFGADRDEIAFSGDVATLPIVGADPHLNKLVLDYCERALADRRAPRGVLRANVENAITALLPHAQAGLENVAGKLGISPRTLRRKLAAEGLTFARILEEFRLALAKRYLAEHDLPVSRIAWLLGYTEVSAFSHAFRRWTGRPPRADRQRPRRHTALSSAKRRAHS
ncbi:MAG TPA: AraC family transcriptional regulator ligand-binding domain-containing protein [Xanthobacteraceae bacterium]|nr:AraC family transcriptional regulator ligand-binding domain-containing protein [Xanthobacteraceae bacterium]